MKFGDIKAASRNYNFELDEFIFLHQLPKTWFEGGQDHVAVKDYNAKDYNRLIGELLPYTDLISEVQVNDRRIAAAKLLGEHAIQFVMSFNPYSMVEWIEVMETRPEDQSDEPPHLDHQEIFVPQGIIPVRSVLRRKNIAYLDQENPAHSWVSVIINPQADELKFTDRQLSDIVAADLKTGRTRVL